MENNDNAQCRPDRRAGPLDEGKFGKYFVLALFLLSLAAFISVIRVFLVDVVVAAVIATLFSPAYKQLLKLFRGHRGTTAFISCLIILVGLLIPVLIISDIVVLQAIDLYRTFEPRASAIFGRGDIVDFINNSPLGVLLSRNDIDLQSLLQEGARTAGSVLGNLVKQTSRATLNVIVDGVIVLFTVFYFLRDGERMLHAIRRAVPLTENHKDMIVDRFVSISEATVKGILLIALLQSFLGTITLMIFGVDAWLLWGVVMLVFAVIPFVGTGGVLIPAGIVSIIAGNVWQGITIILISLGFISTIDNFIRPRIIGAHARMHDLLVFFSLLGGIIVFGPAGFLIGPLIAAIFLTLLEIYRVEFQEHIEYPQKAVKKKTE